MKTLKASEPPAIRVWPDADDCTLHQLKKPKRKKQKGLEQEKITQILPVKVALIYLSNSGHFVHRDDVAMVIGNIRIIIKALEK